MSGWIKLHRKFKNWEWYTDQNTKNLFIHLLLMAQHEDTKFRGVEIKRGQLLTGRKKLAETLKITEQSVRTSLSRLKSTNEITTKTTSKYSVITVCNYDSYQRNDIENDQQINQHSNQQLTINQPTTNHMQECKELKNVRNKEKIPPIPPQGGASDDKPKWKKSFKSYEEEFQRQLTELENDTEWWEERRRWHPNLDVDATVTKAINDFWGQEAGWENKKRKRSKSFSVKQTLTNALAQRMNQVFKKDSK